MKSNITVQVLLFFIIISTVGHIFVAFYNPTLPIWWVLAGGYGVTIFGMLLAVAALNLICMVFAWMGEFLMNAFGVHGEEPKEEEQVDEQN